MTANSDSDGGRGDWREVDREAAAALRCNNCDLIPFDASDVWK